MQITVADIQKIDIKDGQTLVVFIDVHNLRNQIATQIIQDAGTFMRQVITNPNVNIIVVPNEYSFGVIDSTIQPGQILNGKSNNKSLSPDDAFDHAMKGLG